MTTDDADHSALAWGVVRGRRVTTDQMQLARQLRRRMTPEERLLWQELRAHRLDGLHFRRQQVIDGYVADFYCHAAKLVVEVDGPIHDAQREYDEQRDRVLAANGLRVVRVSNNDVRQRLPTVLDRIRHSLT